MSFAIDDQARVLRNDDGTWRVGKTRVTLDSIVSAFRQGSTPERIQEGFPTLDLPDVYDVIAHYLRHKVEIDRYLAERQKAARSLQIEMERRFPPEGVRERLKARLKE